MHFKIVIFHTKESYFITIYDLRWKTIHSLCLMVSIYLFYLWYSIAKMHPELVENIKKYLILYLHKICVTPFLITQETAKTTFKSGNCKKTRVTQGIRVQRIPELSVQFQEPRRVGDGQQSRL